MATTMSGPLLDGRAEAIADRGTRAMSSDLADESLRRVHQRLGQVLRHPTGYYSSHVVKTMRSDGYDVTDSRVVYGPWLEGVGSRNARSRFKGYRTFQIIGQQLERDAGRIVRPDVDVMIRELS